MYLVNCVLFSLLINIEGVQSSMEVARGKQTNASSTYGTLGLSFNSSLVVDGNTSNNLFCRSCMHTHPAVSEKEAYFIISLNGTFSIKLVEIFYRDDYTAFTCEASLSNSVKTNYRFKGYSIHISNSTDFKDGVTCYRDTSDSYPPLHVNDTCIGIGSYLTVYNNNFDNQNGGANFPVLELCEVKVYGCMVGYFSPQCSTRCPNCKDDSCDPDSGVCTYGCKDGWLGEMCNTPCLSGFYGANCSAKCGSCIRNETCDYVAGNCTDCARGYQSPLCDTTCQNKTYGYNCNEACGDCLNSEACDILYGSCMDGCDLGWTGPLCKTECTKKTFGYNCNETCGTCMDQVQCNRFNGGCPNGCDAGWKGNKCKTECPFGYYGKNCQTKCGSCDNNGTCNRFTGNCEQGCSEGFGGSLCNDTCQNRTYGKNCVNTCGNCINGDVCDIYNGTCIHGCAAGWKSLTCTEECLTGEYGLDCKETCGNCFNDATCNRFNGTCIDGCSAGWNGSLCNEVCMGWYGQNCEMKCSDNCKGNSSCDHISGICPQGCNVGFSEPDCTTKERSSPEEQTGSPVAAIGGGVAAALLAVVVILAVLFFIRRRRQGNGRNKGPSFDEIQERNNHSFSHKKNGNVYENVVGIPKKQNSLATAESLQSLDEDTEMETAIDDDAVLQEDEQVYMNQGGISKIRVSDIREVIARKKEGKVFEAEYKGLPKGLKHPHNEGTKPENKMKNRYLTTFPYDHSLVRISKEKGKNNSDYINANYIDSVQGKRDYIATQGPKVGTNSDFWKMAWETGSGKIVMLTNVVELGKKKCEMYWPEDSSSPSNYGYFQIRLLDEKMYGSFAIRNLELKNTKTNETRMVGHFHFTSWPDHGTPDPIQLLMFYDIFRNAKTYAKGPSIVHCSAGIGRTGVFIGLDALLRGGRTEGEIDVYEFVNQMRYNRMNMIQTLDQYIFLHDALAEAFMLDRSTIYADDFTKKHQNATRNDVPKNKSKYKKEFQNLDGIRPVVNSDSAKEALSKENQSKNKSKNIIPDTKFRPVLYSQSEGRSNYINAVYLPTLRNKNGLIATQYPLKATVEDFWCLVYDHQSKIVVVLQPVDESVPVYSTTGKEIQHGSFVIQEKSCKTSVAEGIKERKIQLKKNGDGSSSETLTILEVSSWRLGDVPQENLVDLIMEINSLQKECEDDPVTVVCPDGASRCGLFSVLYAALQSLTELNEVNIFQTTRQMQLRRSQFLTSFEQYVFCYKVVNDHLENSNIYINTGS